MEFFIVLFALIGAAVVKVAPFVLALCVLWLLWKLVALVFRGIGAVFSWLTGGV